MAIRKISVKRKYQDVLIGDFVRLVFQKSTEMNVGDAESENRKISPILLSVSPDSFKFKNVDIVSI